MLLLGIAQELWKELLSASSSEPSIQHQAFEFYNQEMQKTPGQV